MKVLSLFDGISCGMVALERANIKVDEYVAYEIDKYAIQVSQKNYPQIKQKGSVVGADFTPYKGFDLLIGGSPCFVGNTLVLTNNGLKEIQNVTTDDLVLTHTNQFKNVLGIKQQGVKQIFELKSMNSDSILTTENHKFFVRQKHYTYDKTQPQYDDKHKRTRFPRKRTFDSPTWLTIKELMQSDHKGIPMYKNYYVGSAINQNSIIPHWDGVKVQQNQFNEINLNNLDMSDKDLWYLAGRFVRDGWFKKNRKGQYRADYNDVVICCGKHKLKAFEKKISTTFKYTLVEERTVYKLHFSNTELAYFLLQFGEHADKKKIPSFVFDLPIPLLRSFIEGYLDTDGCEINKFNQITTVSRELAYGIANCIMKAYTVPCSVHLNKVPSTKIIENRIVNQKNFYTVKWSLDTTKKQHAFYENGYVWYPISSIIDTNSSDIVWDISVDKDHSFMANNTIVHNCQDLCAMGSRKGLEGEKSGLFYEYVRALKEVQPTYFLLENNSSMTKENRDIITSIMGVEPIEINSNLLSAQDRKRLYWTNIPFDEMPIDKGLCLRDIVQPESEKLDYDITERMKAKVKGTLAYKKTWSNVRTLDRKFRCITTAQTICNSGSTNISYPNGRYYKPTPIECERGQTLPDNYTQGLSDTQRYKCIGNGWTVDIIAYIFKGLK